MILGIYHVNINVTDIERSTEFYGLLGFRVVDSFHERGTPGLDRGLGMPYTDTRARFLALGNTRHETVLDLVEWIEPEASKPEIQLNQIGMPRLCLRVKDLDGEVERLKSHGVEFCICSPGDRYPGAQAPLRAVPRPRWNYPGTG